MNYLFYFPFCKNLKKSFNTQLTLKKPSNKKTGHKRYSKVTKQIILKQLLQFVIEGKLRKTLLIQYYKTCHQEQQYNHHKRSRNNRVHQRHEGSEVRYEGLQTQDTLPSITSIPFLCTRRPRFRFPYNGGLTSIQAGDWRCAMFRLRQDKKGANKPCLARAN